MGREAGRVAAGLVGATDHAAEYRSLLDEHLALRRAYYAMETRWPDLPFWARRQRTVRPNSAAVCRTFKTGEVW